MKMRLKTKLVMLFFILLFAFNSPILLNISLRTVISEACIGSSPDTAIRQFFSSVQSMAKSTVEITPSAKEGANGTSNIARKAGDILYKSQKIIAETDRVAESSDMLMNMVMHLKY